MFRQLVQATLVAALICKPGIGAAFSQQNRTILATSAPVRLTLTIVTTPLRTPVGGLPLSEALRPSAEPKRFRLVLSDFRTDQQPGVVYQVFLCTGRDSVRPQGSLIGTINFYGAPNPSDRDRPVAFRTFDVTDLVLSLGARLVEAPCVRIEPVGTPNANAHPKIDKIELVAGR